MVDSLSVLVALEAQELDSLGHLVNPGVVALKVVDQLRLLRVDGLKFSSNIEPPAFQVPETEKKDLLQIVNHDGLALSLLEEIMK